MVSVKEGPHDANPDGFTERLALAGVTLLVSTTAAETGGAHLKESVALPVPVLAGTFIVSGFVDQRALGDEVAAKPTAA